MDTTLSILFKRYCMSGCGEISGGCCGVLSEISHFSAIIGKFNAEMEICEIQLCGAVAAHLSPHSMDGTFFRRKMRMPSASGPYNAVKARRHLGTLHSAI